MISFHLNYVYGKHDRFFFFKCINSFFLRCRCPPQVMLYTEPDFQGECHLCDKNQESLSDKLIAKSFRVVGGRWDETNAHRANILAEAKERKA